MTATSTLRGHDIYWDGAQWRFCDTRAPTVSTHSERPCGHCGRYDTPEGHDGCLGTLPGVMNACCGHGRPREAYVQYPDGTTVRGPKALGAIEAIRTAEPNLARLENKETDE